MIYYSVLREIVELQSNTPNDYEFGKKVRAIINQYNKKNEIPTNMVEFSDTCAFMLSYAKDKGFLPSLDEVKKVTLKYFDGQTFRGFSGFELDDYLELAYDKTKEDLKEQSKS